MINWIRRRIAMARRRRALARLERASGVIAMARVRLLPGPGLSLMVEDQRSPDLRIVRLDPNDGYRLGRQLIKRARKGGA